MRSLPTRAQAVVVGAGQAGLATSFYLRRAGLVPGDDFVVLDAAESPGGAWPRMWERLRLFSPSTASSLPGWMMPPWDDRTHGYPPRAHVVGYLTEYEKRYSLSVLRPHRVLAVRRADEDPDGDLVVEASTSRIATRAVVSATGTWESPFRPSIAGSDLFAGLQLHAADYRRPEDLAGRRVVVVGGGNSAAQIVAEVSTTATTTWVTRRPPRFLPDDVDGRDLFAAATARLRALDEGREHGGVGGLGDIVMVPEVREARDRGVLDEVRPMFSRMTPTGVAWPDGREELADVVIWCTGFRPALRHLAPLGLRGPDGRVAVDGPSGTQAVEEPRVFLVGYGDWTGPASATLVGVGPSARATAAAVVGRLHAGPAGG
ncbi:ArsO family NAD(P)H-dependent flavin-containing monooxygenase [Nocardioides sp.]|uniref:ArsO family NAD(P)H-dependent flavin-containing monooxygenase n=1 Tax=Nocardioides sp. TaxID=35761 RepID=UPI0035634C67